MSITRERYTVIRDRLIELFNTINHRSYPMFIKPSSLLTVEQLRERENYTSINTVEDPNFFDEFQNRSLTIPKLLDILPNFINSSELGFRNPNDSVIEIYENIQEYLSLWTQLMLAEPNVNHPPMSELRKLEGLAYFIFGTYKKIRPFVTDMEHRDLYKEEASLNQRGLMGLGAIMSLNSMGVRQTHESDSFISHLDSLESSQEALLAPETHPLYFGSNNQPDSMAIVEKAVSDPNWAFRSN